MRNRFLARVLIAMLVLTLMGASFGWGFLTHQKGIFPHKLLRALVRSTGATPPRDETVMARAREVEKLLTALPYVSGTLDPDSERTGILIDQRDRVFEGLNFYGSRTEDRAFLIDLGGKVVHEWIFPSFRWQHLELLPNGDVLAVKNGKHLIRVNKKSELLWTYKADFHHSVWVDQGDIYGLISEPRLMPDVHPAVNIRDDLLVVLSGDGELKEKVSFMDLLLDSPYAYLLPSVSHMDFREKIEEEGAVNLDVLHVNSVEVFDGRLAGISELFAEGNILTSIKHINAIAILDGGSREVVWLWGPTNLILQHHPVLLDNGNIMVFSNGNKHSKIIELDPIDLEIVWQYEDPEEFFTRTRGSNQRLPNGNTLITESDTGYVFEVTTEGEKVWEFANPDVDSDGVRSAIWRMKRFPVSEITFLR